MISSLALKPAVTIQETHVKQVEWEGWGEERWKVEGGSPQYLWPWKHGGICTIRNLGFTHLSPTSDFHLHFVLGCPLVKEVLAGSYSLCVEGLGLNLGS